MHRRNTWSLSLALTAVLLVPRAATALCISGIPLCEQFWDYAAVFQGRVTTIVQEDGDPRATRDEDLPFRAVTFDVERVWRGNVGAQVTLHLPGGPGLWVEDSFAPALFGTYVIFASRYPDGSLTTGSCAPNVRVGGADGDVLTFLKSLDRPSSGGRIFGTIYDRRTPSPRGSTPPTVDAKVTVEGDRVRKTIQTRGGSYEFDRLRPGRYTVSIEPPLGGAAATSSFEVNVVDPHACVRRNFALERRR